MTNRRIGHVKGQPVRFVVGHNSRTRPMGEELFWTHVDKDGPVPDYAPHLGPCWIWTGTITKYGYSQIKVQRRTHFAYKWYYERLNGPTAEGLQLDHLCRVRACVNPGHLEPVTAAINARRSPLRTPHGQYIGLHQYWLDRRNR